MFSLDLHSWWEAGSNSANTPWGAFNVKGFTLHLLSSFFFLITGELSECHQVFLWTTGGHQAVYVELETNALFLCYVCVIFTVSSQRSDRTLRRRTPMTPWRFIRCRYSVGLNHCFLIIIILFLSLRKEFVCHLIFFFFMPSSLQQSRGTMTEIAPTGRAGTAPLRRLHRKPTLAVQTIQVSQSRLD